MKTKKLQISHVLLVWMMIVSACASVAQANPDEVSLSTAIRDAAARMESRLDG